MDALQPVLVILDPLYVYHPAGVEAQNLYDRGRMLSELSAFFGYERTALVVVDHYRKASGASLDLDEIGQSGVAQWADSWILQTHRQEPDLKAGKYKLATEFGSRQWGGQRLDVDWDCGIYDPMLSEVEGEVSWTIESSLPGVAKVRKDSTTIEAAISEWMAANPHRTKAEIEAGVREVSGISVNRVRAAFGEMALGGRVREERRKRVEGGVEKERTVWVAGNGRIQLRRQLRPDEDKIAEDAA
jgi:hypothetical protein